MMITLKKLTKTDILLSVIETVHRAGGRQGGILKSRIVGEKKKVPKRKVKPHKRLVGFSGGD